MAEPLITFDQYDALSRAMFPHVNFTVRLVKRLEAIHMRHDDKLMIAARKAHEAMAALRMVVHYRTCKSGVADVAFVDTRIEPSATLLSATLFGVCQSRLR